MLDRAVRKTRERGLGQVEPLRADAAELPLPDSCADLFLAYWGLHCFDRPVDAGFALERFAQSGTMLFFEAQAARAPK